MRSWMRSGAAAGVMVALLGAGVPSAWAAEPGDYQDILAGKAPPLVTIKYVLKLQMGSMGAQESDSETTGVMIDPHGLVLTSNTQLGGISAMLRGMGREISATPTDIKVLVGDDTEGLDAKLLARDTELDLAWVQIKEPGDRRFEYIDPGKGVEAKVGQAVLALRRMGKFFDRAVVVGESRVGGETKKPRRLYVPTVPLMSYLGLPVFTTEGKLVGVAVMQMPSEEDAEENAAAMFTRMSSMQDMMSGLILPAADVVEATRRAKEIAATQPASEEAPAAPQNSSPAADDEQE